MRRGDRSVVLLGSTELLDAAKLAGLSSARDAVADIAAALARVQPAVGEAKRVAWHDVHVHAARATSLLDAVIPPGTRTLAGPTVGRQHGGVADAEDAALQLRGIAGQALVPAGAAMALLDGPGEQLFLGLGKEQLQQATTALDRARRSSIWDHVAPNAGEVRVHFDDGEAIRMVGDARATGSAIERRAIAAHAELSAVQDWFRTRFGHLGFDGKGRDVDMHLEGPDRDSYAAAELTASGEGIIHAAAVDGTRSGRSGITLRSPAADGRVMTHEYAHLVLRDAFGHVPVGDGPPTEAGLLEDAVHEGLADVFAAIRYGTWSVGENMLHGAVPAAGTADARMALRFIGKPSASLDPQARTLQEAERMLRAGETDPHVIGAVVANASRRMQGQIGWKQLGDLTWATVRSGRLHAGNVDPENWAAATMQTARELWSGTDAGRARIARVQIALRKSGFVT